MYKMKVKIDFCVEILSLLLFILSFTKAREFRHGGIKILENTNKGQKDNPDLKDNCEIEISFLDILLLCHSQERPAVLMGRGEFSASYLQGNFGLNDTVLEKVPMTDFNFPGDPSFPEFEMFNAEIGVGVVIRLHENLDEGTLQISLGFREQWYPKVSDYNRFWLELVAEEDEYIFGGGEQYTYLNLRGRTYPIWVREQGVGRNKSADLAQIMGAAGGDYHTTYWPQPSFLSSRRYHLTSSFPTYHELDLTSPSRHSIYWHSTVPVLGKPGGICSTCHITILAKPSLMEVVQALSPGQPELPDWVYNGAILGVQGGTDVMMDYYNKAKEAGIKVSAMWIQDWSGKITTAFGTRVFWNWKWNEEWYPGLDQVILDLDSEGVKMTVYMTAHLNTDGSVYQSMADQDYWVMNNQGQVLIQDFGEFNVSTVDITEVAPDCNCINIARMWYKNLIKENILDLGIAGWMADFGEYLPIEARSSYAARWWGKDHSEVLHQTFSEDWASLNKEAVKEAGKEGQILYWMRSGGIKSKFDQAMSWAGDQNVDWTQSDGLPSSIVAALSLATSGMGLSHSDIGGYTGHPLLSLTRSKELLLRWAEYSAFTPIMRTHEGNVPEANHQVYTDLDTMSQFGRLTQIYVALSNYTKAAVRQNFVDHTPVMRPLFLVFPQDKNTFNQEYSYMYGDDLLVSPVLEPSVSSWEVYLPGPELWVALWDEYCIEGPKYFNVSAPLGKPPVFYRFGSKWTDLFADIRNRFDF